MNIRERPVDVDRGRDGLHPAVDHVRRRDVREHFQHGLYARQGIPEDQKIEGVVEEFRMEREEVILRQRSDRTKGYLLSNIAVPARKVSEQSESVLFPALIARKIKTLLFLIPEPFMFIVIGVDEIRLPSIPVRVGFGQ